MESLPQAAMIFRVAQAALFYLGVLTLPFSCSSCCRLHRSIRPIAIQPLIFPIPCKSLNHSSLACYSLPCIPKLILAKVPHRTH
jgi:hypothetical protein